jgi:hypothetical protein
MNWIHTHNMIKGIQKRDQAWHIKHLRKRARHDAIRKAHLAHPEHRWIGRLLDESKRRALSPEFKDTWWRKAIAYIRSIVKL